MTQSTSIWQAGPVSAHATVPHQQPSMCHADNLGAETKHRACIRVGCDRGTKPVYHMSGSRHQNMAPIRTLEGRPCAQRVAQGLQYATGLGQKQPAPCNQGWCAPCGAHGKLRSSEVHAWPHAPLVPGSNRLPRLSASGRTVSTRLSCVHGQNVLGGCPDPGVLYSLSSVMEEWGDL